MLVRKSICCKTFQGGSWGGGGDHIYIYIYMYYRLYKDHVGSMPQAMFVNFPAGLRIYGHRLRQNKLIFCNPKP